MNPATPPPPPQPESFGQAAPRDRSRRILVLPFLSRFDSWLLKNYPDLWSARLHLVLYFLILFDAAFSFLCWIFPDDSRSDSSIGYWVAAATLLAGIGLILWLVFLFRFNVFKRYGNLKTGDRLRTFLMYFITMLLLSTTIFVPLLAEQIKADVVYGDDEIVEDVNTMNICIGILEKDHIHMELKAETLIVGSWQNYTQPFPTNSYSYIDSSEIRWRLSSADSVQKLDDTGYVVIDMTDIKFISSGSMEEDADQKEYGTIDLYNVLYKHPPPFSETEARRRFSELASKYYLAENKKRYDYYSTDELQSYIGHKYDLPVVRTAIHNISSRKHHFRDSEIPTIIIITMYFALGLTLLLYAFRHCTIRTFFFSLLVGIVLAILTGLIGAIFHWKLFDFLLAYIFYYMPFLVLSITIPLSKKRSLIKGIALNFTLWMTYAVPVVLVGIYYEWHRDILTWQFEALYYEEYYHTMRLRYEIAQYTGAAILLLMVAFVFSYWYRTWYAQPEE